MNPWPDDNDDEGEVEFLCECGSLGCERCAPMTTRAYRDLPLEWPGLALSPEHGDDPDLDDRQ